MRGLPWRGRATKKFGPYSLESIPTLRAGCITIINLPPVQNFNPRGFHFTQTNYNHIFPSNNFFSSKFNSDNNNNDDDDDDLDNNNINIIMVYNLKYMPF